METGEAEDRGWKLEKLRAKNGNLEAEDGENETLN